MTIQGKTFQPVDVEPSIVTVCNQKVILDTDLALLYGVPTKRLNEQMKRNRNRFPADGETGERERRRERITSGGIPIVHHSRRRYRIAGKR